MAQKKTKATVSEIKKIKKMYKDAINTPCMALTSAQALSGNDFASMAYNRLYDYIDSVAVKHGYAKKKHAYGIDTKTGAIIERKDYE